MCNESGTSKHNFMLTLAWQYTEAAVRSCFTKWVFLEISQIHMTTLVRESLFNNVGSFQPATFFKKEALTQAFSNFGKIFKNTFFIEEFCVATSGVI